jgi:hypothetical protein
MRFNISNMSKAGQIRSSAAVWLKFSLAIMMIVTYIAILRLAELTTH